MTDSTVIDIRQIPPAERHPSIIIRAFEALQAGEALTIVNDHDPRQLRELFESQRQGQARWEDLEQGPPIWRVRLTRL